MILTNHLNPRVFVAKYPAAFVFADREREERSDYQTIATIAYRDLEITWNPRWKPSSADDDNIIQCIQQDRDNLQQHIGERIEISTSGQTVMLGSSLIATR